MRILVFSDTHKHTESCVQVLERIIGVDMVLHAGDHASDAMELQEIFPDIPIKYVAGNCDFLKAPQELVVEADGKRIFLTHGHAYSVKYEENYSSLRQRTAELGCDCAVFGHTHQGFNDCTKTPVLLNPGSIKQNGTFGVIEIEGGMLKTAVCNV